MNTFGNIYLKGPTGPAAPEPQITQTLYVDGNRTDIYVESGSISKPFKTIQAAVAAASGNVLLNVAPGEYAGDVDLGSHVTTVRGSGLNATFFAGNITAGDRAHVLEDFRLLSTGSLVITNLLSLTNAHLQGAMTISGSGSLDARTVSFDPAAGVVPLTMDGANAILFDCFLEAENVSAINQTAGTLVIFHSYAQNNSFTAPTVNSSGGVCGIIDTSAYNLGFGPALNLDNGGSALLPNTVRGALCAGNVSCGSKHTIIDGLNFVGFGSLSGTNLIYSSSTMKTGITQVAAGAAAGELWADSDDDFTVKLGQ